ncbi:hypothetical protein RND81_08G025100 [Saponaria officinalis]
MIGNEGFNSYENADIQADVDVVSEDKTESILDSVHTPDFVVNNFCTQTNRSFLANVGQPNPMESIVTSNRVHSHRYDNCIPLHNVNCFVSCFRFTNEIHAMVGCQVNCNLIDNAQLPNAYNVLDKMSQPTSCKDNTLTVEVIKYECIQVAGTKHFYKILNILFDGCQHLPQMPHDNNKLHCENSCSDCAGFHVVNHDTNGIFTPFDPGIVINHMPFFCFTYTLEVKGDFRGDEDTSEESTWKLLTHLGL